MFSNEFKMRFPGGHYGVITWVANVKLFYTILCSMKTTSFLELYSGEKFPPQGMTHIGYFRISNFFERKIVSNVRPSAWTCGLRAR